MYWVACGQPNEKILRSRKPHGTLQSHPQPEALRLEELNRRRRNDQQPQLLFSEERRIPGGRKSNPSKRLSLCLPCRVPCHERKQGFFILQAVWREEIQGIGHLSSSLAASQLLGASCSPIPACLGAAHTIAHMGVEKSYPNFVVVDLWMVDDLRRQLMRGSEQG